MRHGKNIRLRPRRVTPGHFSSTATLVVLVILVVQASACTLPTTRNESPAAAAGVSGGATLPTRASSPAGSVGSAAPGGRGPLPNSSPERVDAAVPQPTQPVPNANAGGAGSSAAGSGAPAIQPSSPREGEPWTSPAPRAVCRAGDATDQALSGLSGDVRCNLELLGQVEAPHYLSMAWYGTCAYVNGTDGTTVIQVSPEGVPTVTKTLTEVGFRNNWESMKASPVTGLLVGYEANGPTLTVYDVKSDCSNPVLLSSRRLEGALGDSIGHAGNFSPDGTIYYASSMYTGELTALDLADPKQPKVISQDFERGAHDLFIGKDGTRGYFAYADLLRDLGAGSFAVMDLSEVQARKPGAKGKLIAELTWQDGNTSQYPVLVQYGGRDHLIITDELGSGTCDDPVKPQWGYARIVDLSDETSPKLVSLIKTEAQDPKNCQAASEAQGGTDGFGVGTHYCNVDRLVDPRILSCGEWDAGVRLFDIRNPARPVEVAYFDSGEGTVPGLQHIDIERRQLWVAATPGTFYVLRFPAGSVVDQILAQ